MCVCVYVRVYVCVYVCVCVKEVVDMFILIILSTPFVFVDAPNHPINRGIW